MGSETYSVKIKLAIAERAQPFPLVQTVLVYRVGRPRRWSPGGSLRVARSGPMINFLLWRIL